MLLAPSFSPIRQGVWTEVLSQYLRSFLITQKYYVNPKKYSAAENISIIKLCQRKVHQVQRISQSSHLLVTGGMTAVQR